MHDLDPFQPLLRQGLSLQKAGRLLEAERLYRAVVTQAPQHPMALHLAGTVVGQLGRWGEAIALLQRCLELSPADPMAWSNLATALLDAGKFTGALDAAAKALALSPNYASAWFSWGAAASGLGRHADAIEAFRKVVLQQPRHGLAWAGMWRAAVSICDWACAQTAAAQVHAMLEKTPGGIPPFDALALTDDPSLHFRCAQATAQRLLAQEAFVPCEHLPRPHGERIRLAYLSADLHEHATAYMMAELFERHDRQRFEVVAVSFGPDDASPMRQRLGRVFDEFWDVRSSPHEAVVQRMLDANIDIAIDLKGFTRDSRPSILLRKPAPIVVSYLGYPGTMGASTYDYLIGDAVVTPQMHAHLYAEQLVQMPNSYQVNDTHRMADPVAPTREEEGLPVNGFVFAAFNNVYKITPQFFGVWMRLLAALPGSVLWLLNDNNDARRNLRAQATAQGVDPQRLIFARRVPLPKHLARHVHAGLLLDNLPCNAHTTTSDALWMGVPVVTCMGQGFAGRVAASLLHAVGLPELVTQSLSEYEAMALRLASEPQALEFLRNHLVAVRSSAPLFDAAGFTAHLEAAYEHMHHRWQQGLPAQSFAVEGLGALAAGPSPSRAFTFLKAVQ